jgi:hypothetical protein
MATRATKAQHRRRIEEVEELLVRGLSRRQIHMLVSQRTAQGDDLWQIGTRRIDAYLALAHTEIAAHGHIDRRYEAGRAVARLDGLFASARASHDDSLALRVQHEIDRFIVPRRGEDQHEKPDAAAVRRALRVEFAKMIDAEARDAKP